MIQSKNGRPNILRGMSTHLCRSETRSRSGLMTHRRAGQLLEEVHASTTSTRGHVTIAKREYCESYSNGHIDGAPRHPPPKRYFVPLQAIKDRKPSFPTTFSRE